MFTFYLKRILLIILRSRSRLLATRYTYILILNEYLTKIFAGTKKFEIYSINNRIIREVLFANDSSRIIRLFSFVMPVCYAY